MSPPSHARMACRTPALRGAGLPPALKVAHSIGLASIARIELTRFGCCRLSAVLPRASPRRRRRPQGKRAPPASNCGDAVPSKLGGLATAAAPPHRATPPVPLHCPERARVVEAVCGGDLLAGAGNADTEMGRSAPDAVERVRGRAPPALQCGRAPVPEGRTGREGDSHGCRKQHG